ncbi:MAG: tRNA (adenosine(37)-N6)-threonylcarbamoyltransferase complex dimerization subunit type 1 TsaB [Cyanobacteria bacterium P01_F01_bin.150]
MHSLIPHALGLHTTTPQLGLSRSHPLTGSTHETWELGRDMSTQLHEYLFTFIGIEELQNLDFIAVAHGPGGFTSTRLGVVTARTLAQQLNIPLFGISSLAAYVWHHIQRRNNENSPSQKAIKQKTSNQEANNQEASNIDMQPVPDAETLTAIHMPARRGQVFGAVYSVTWGEGGIPKELVSYKDAHVIDAETWQTYLKSEYSQPMTTMEISGPLGYTVSSVLELAAIDYQKKQRPHWSSVEPFYGQSPV